MGRVLGGIRLSDVLRPKNGLIQLYREPHSSSPFPSAFASSTSALSYAAGGHGHLAQRPDRLGAGGRHRHLVLPQNQNGITKQPGGVPKAEASRLRFYKLCAPFGYLSRALWSAPPMVNAARGPVWVQTTAVSSGASGSAASRASTEIVVERESRVVNTRVFTP